MLKEMATSSRNVGSGTIIIATTSTTNAANARSACRVKNPRTSPCNSRDSALDGVDGLIAMRRNNRDFTVVLQMTNSQKRKGLYPPSSRGHDSVGQCPEEALR